MAGWPILITNLAEVDITVDEICRLYGSRWRIETLFRSWKRDKRWTGTLRPITNRHHLEALALAGIIHALLTMALLRCIGDAERKVMLSLEKTHQTMGTLLTNLTLDPPDIALAARLLPSIKLEKRISKSTKNQMVECLG